MSDLKLLLTVVLTGTSLFCPAQQKTKAPGQVILNDAGTSELREKWLEVNKRTNGRVPGYRVKIYFGLDREKANTIKQNFLLKYQTFNAYEKYEQPNFIIVAGDFRTRLEAYKFLKDISVDFPYAFIVKDNIELPKLRIEN
jgi:hypothetical protein